MSMGSASGEWPKITIDLVTELEKEIERAYEADEDLAEDDKLTLDTLLIAVKVTLEHGSDEGIDVLEPMKHLIPGGNDEDGEEDNRD